jgi:hypothetical protein
MVSIKKDIEAVTRAGGVAGQMGGGELEEGDVVYSAGDMVKCEGCSKAVPHECAVSTEDPVYLCARCALSCADAAYGELVAKVEGVVGAVGAISKFPEDVTPLVQLLFLPESHEAAHAMFDTARVGLKVRKLENGALDCVGCLLDSEVPKLHSCSFRNPNQKA